MEFIKLNKNPKGWKTGDCVIRAISEALDVEWEEVFDDLYKIARKKCRTMDDKVVIEKYLQDKGFIREKMPRHDDNSRYTVKELIDEQGEGKIMLIFVAHHLTCSVGDKLIDTWDCSYKSCGNYWAVPTTRKITKVKPDERYTRRVQL